MANYNVRVLGFRGVQQIPLINSRQFSSDSVFQLIYPYEFSQTLSIAPGGGAVSSAADAGKQTQILRIEVPDGQTIRYEINPPGRAIAAGANSPSLSGKDQFSFAVGWSVSIADIGAYL
jgi:hypothetical protein